MLRYILSRVESWGLLDTIEKRKKVNGEPRELFAKPQ